MSKANLMKFMMGSVAALVLAACSNPQAQEEQTNDGSTGAGGPTVTVAQVVHERITEWDEFSGRLQAPQTVELMPRVSGYVETVHFEEGAIVEAGELLVEIDPRPFTTEVNRLKAELQSAQSAADQADNEYQRGKRLSEQRAISDELLDSRLARRNQTAATVASVSAALRRAELDLEFTKVTAPISGRVSYAEVTAGNYVSAGQSRLTSVVSTEKMYAYFNVDEQSYLKYVRLTENGQRVDTRDGDANPVYMALADSADFEHVGSIDFVDNRLDAQTGTIRIRAAFKNTEDDLLPGLYARVRLVGSDTYQGILIDEKAIGTDLNNKFVLVVNEDSELEYRAIKLGETINGLRIVESGLSADDRIVVNGLQRVRPGMEVVPQMVPMTTPERIAELREIQQRLDQLNHELMAQIESTDSRG